MRAKTDRKTTRKGTDRGPGPRGPGDPRPVAEPEFPMGGSEGEVSPELEV